MDEQIFKKTLNILKQLIADIENGKYEFREVSVKREAIPKASIGNWNDWEEWEPSKEVNWHIKLRAKEESDARLPLL
jgi:hypothetical protein